MYIIFFIVIRVYVCVVNIRNEDIYVESVTQ